MAKNAKRHKVKQDGVRTKSYCPCCQTYGCGYFNSLSKTRAEIKRTKRFELGQCRGCGKENCVCRSSEYKKW